MIRSLVGLFMFFALEVCAQQSTNSPYSIHGLGQQESSSITGMNSMGGVGTAVVNPLWINAANPASYGDITRPSFNFDLKNENYTLSSAGSSQSANAFSIQNLSFAFPVINNRKKFKRRMGLSFGLSPYTSSGYELSFSSDNADLGTIEYHFFGSGGIDKLSAGLGLDILTNEKRTDVLTAGINAQYIFGNIERNRATQFESGTVASSLFRSSTIEISDVGFDGGLRYFHIDTVRRRVYLNDTTVITNAIPVMTSVGISISPALSLATSIQQIEYTYTDSFQRPNIIDTLVSDGVTGETNVPLSFAAGVSFNINNAWTFALDYKLTQWSKLIINGGNAGLNDATRIGLGVEWVPEYDKRGRGKYARVVRYRLGGNFEQTLLNISDVQPIRYGINFGLGLPLGVASSSTSMFNVGGEVAQRQTAGSNFSETFFNIYAGFTITPHRYDQWFAKRKYD